MWKIAVRAFWLLLPAGLLALVVANHHDLGHVLAIWFSGRQTSSSSLWGLSMVWWGRIGKLMQFVAGCVIILDLIGPTRLRAIGKQATGRSRGFPTFAARIRELAALMTLHEHIQERIIRIYVTADGGLWTLVDKPPEGRIEAPLPDQSWFTLNMINRLRTKIRREIKQVPCKCRTDSKHDDLLRKERVAYTYSEITKFFRDRLPAHERDLFDQQRALQRVESPALVILILMLVLTVAFAVMATRTGLGPWGWILALAAFVSFGILAATLVERRVALGLRLQATLIGGITRPVAALLDRNLPGHQLRWIGFLLFIFGFSLDLLAT